MPKQNQLMLLVGLVLLSSFLSRLPVLNLAVYPFRLFATFVHELSHGLAAFLTGGALRRFEVFANGEGLAWSTGGWRWVVASAGYIGSTIAGAVLLIMAARGVSAQRIILVLGIGLAIACVLFVRNPFGIVSGLLIAGALIFAALKLAPRWNEWLLLFLAVQTALNAVDSLVDLIKLSTFSRSRMTDAEIMANATGVPALIWAIVWSSISLLVLWQAIRFAYFRNG